jgi:ethanolamine kinase
MTTSDFCRQLMKAINKRPGLSAQEIDAQSVLLRAYGNGTAVLIDRDRKTPASLPSLLTCPGECTSHSLLASHKLAPPLLARFNNGLLYRFIPGHVCSPADLRRPEIWRGVAKRLAQWHAIVPISTVLAKHGAGKSLDPALQGSKISHLPIPNIWTVTQRWAGALPDTTEAQRARKAELQSELLWLIDELGDAPSVDHRPLVFSHCDLLHGNVIVEPPSGLPEPAESSPHSSSASSPTATLDTGTLSRASSSSGTSSSPPPPTATVSFIDYEYATPAPATFDIANHFAEWGGFDCDFSVLPTRAQRRDFLAAYISSLTSFGPSAAAAHGPDEEARLRALMAQVDRFRGAPGFYWGIWALIQATISQIDFDYAGYAEIRLSEYYAWKDALMRERRGEAAPADLPLRERRWAEEG